MSKLVLLDDKAIVASALQQVLMCNSGKGSIQMMRFWNDGLASANVFWPNVAMSTMYIFSTRE